MARPKKLKKQEVIDALSKSHGLKSGAAEILGVAYNTIERYIVESEEARAIIEHFRIRRKDRAEYKLDEAIERGESWAVMFTLKNARDREYSERVDVTSGGDRIVINVIDRNQLDDRNARPAPGADTSSE